LYSICDFLVTPAAADARIVTSIVDRALLCVIAGLKHSSMDPGFAAAVRVVMVVVNLEGFESRPVFWIGFGEVGKRRTVVP